MLREALWRDLASIMDAHTEPWLLAGDFNATLTAMDRQGGSRARAVIKGINVGYCRVPVGD